LICCQKSNYVESKVTAERESLLKTLKHMFSKAVEWEMVETGAVKKIRKIKLPKEVVALALSLSETGPGTRKLMRASFTAYRYYCASYGNEARGDIEPQMGER
jgi:hypothetical protein